MAAVHDLASCSLTFGSAVVIPGGEGEFATFEFPAEFTVQDGNSGLRIRSMNPARVNGSLTLTVYRHEAAHGVMGALYEAQKGQTIRTAAGTFPGLPLSWSDPNTGDTFAAESAAIMQAPSPSFARDAATVTWSIDLAGVTRRYGTAVPTPAV